MPKDMRERSGRPVAPDGEELYECADCGTLWREHSLESAHDLGERFEDGCPMSHYECPDPECGALCFPAEGEPVEETLVMSEWDRTQLRKHMHHELTVGIGKNKKRQLFCKTCGNKKSHVVDESEIGKLETKGA